MAETHLPTKLTLEVVTPDGLLFRDEVDSVQAPGSEGDFGVLAGHAPFMTTLREGRVTVKDGATTKLFDIQGGFADVGPDGFTILAEHAVEVA